MTKQSNLTPRIHTAGTLFFGLLSAIVAVAQAQAQAAPPPAAAPPAAPAAAAPAAAPAPAPEPMPAAAPAPAPEPMPMMEPAAEPMAMPAAPEATAPAPEPEPEAAPAPSPISVGAWAHLGTYAGPGADPEKIQRVSADGTLEIHTSAQLIEHFGLTGNIIGEYGNNVQGGPVSVLDAIGQIEFDPAFNVWLGRMLVPSDRANFSGFWFAAPWSYPGFYVAGPPTGPRQGPYGRNDGVTLWGQAAGGLFKYYAGAYDLQNNPGAALFSGRLNLSLINPEPGYYHSSTYYGGKDILVIAIGGQYQKNGSPGATSSSDDYSEFNADVLFEKNFQEGGVLDLEGAVYKYMGDAEAIDFSYFVLASWMTADKIGWGKLQPLIRLQQEKPTAPGADMNMLLDVQLGYVVDAYATRFALGVQHAKIGTSPADVSSNTIFLGLQLQK